MDNVALAEIKTLLNEGQTNEAEPETKDESTPEAIVDDSSSLDESLDAGAGTDGVADEADSTEGDGGETEPADTEGALETFTVSEHAAAVGWEASDLYGSMMITPTGGEEMTLGAMKDGYQEQAAKITEMESQLVQAQQAATTNQEGNQQYQQMSQDMIQYQGMLSQIAESEKNTNWAELEELDPMEAMMKRQKIDRARNEVNVKLGELQQVEHGKQQQYLQQAQAKMLELMPTWADKAVVATDYAAIDGYLTSYGYNPGMVNSIYDPQMLKLLLDASKHVAAQTKANDAVRKVRNAPKVLKGRKAVADTSGEKVSKLVSKAKSTGSKKDELNAYKAILAKG